MPLHTLPAVIFDLDGTLIDSVGDIHADLNRALAEIGQRPLGRARVQSFVGNGVPVLIQRVVSHLSLDPSRVAPLMERFLHHYEAGPHLTKVYEGVPAALKTLRGFGYPLGLCTNKPNAPTRAILAHLDLAQFFEVMVCGDSLPTRKPDPAPLLATATALSRPIIFVGDSEVDCETAQAADVPFVLFTKGYRKSPIAKLPHHGRFNAFDRLPALIEKLSGKGKMGE